MKKLLYIALVSMSVNAFAQDEATEEVLTTTEESSSASPNLSKNGKQITPEAGDIGLGIDAAPFFTYLGNAMNGTTNNNDPQVQGINQTLMVKYFLSDDMAARVRIGVNQSVLTQINKVQQDKQNDPNVFVDDRFDDETSQMAFAAGVEMRRGNGRVQGYYGGEVFFARQVDKQIYQYGNQMNSDNQDPNSTNWGTNNLQAGGEERVLYNYDGTILNFGVNGLIGVEYFVAPRVSLAGEFTIGFFYTVQGDGHEGYETWSDDDREIIETPTDRFKNRGIQSLPSGNVMANFYF